MQTWIHLYPERLRHEEQALREIGFEPDERLLQEHARLAATGTIAQEGRPITLTIVYPDAFPVVRPEVFAPELRLDRHQNPFARNLCLLDRATYAWDSATTGAALITERVPYLLGLIDQGGAQLRENEVPQGEPATAYLRYEPGTVVLVPEALTEIPADVTAGKFELADASLEPTDLRLRTLLRRVSWKGNKRRLSRLGADDPALSGRFDGNVIEGRWLRLPGLPDGPDAEAMVRAITATDRSALDTAWHTVRGGQVAVTGVILREEVTQGDWQDAWVFLVRFRRLGATGKQEASYLARGERISRAWLSERAPNQRPLSEKTVALLGLGALGAPLAVELARLGVGELRVLDGDTVEVGNTVRWPVGLSAVGHSKVSVIDGWIKTNYPYTKVVGHHRRLGSVPTPDDLAARHATGSDLDLLGELFDEADLVIDASAEIGVQHLVSLVAPAGLPQLYLWATEGAWGGIVAVTERDIPGCWMCLQLGIDDGTIPLPPREPGSGIQPAGCASLTFTGSSAELAPIAAQAARVASRVLRAGGQVEPEVCQVALRDSAGAELSVPDWSALPLQAHPCCDHCSVGNAAAA